MPHLQKDHIRAIAYLTTPKYNNPEWQEYANNRLLDGDLAAAYIANESDMDNFTNLRQLQFVRDVNFRSTKMDYEKEDEISDKVHLYGVQTQQKVIETGIWLFPNGKFAASPDGIIVDKDNTEHYLGLVKIVIPQDVRNV